MSLGAQACACGGREGKGYSRRRFDLGLLPPTRSLFAPFDARLAWQLAIAFDLRRAVRRSKVNHFGFSWRKEVFLPSSSRHLLRPPAARSPHLSLLAWCARESGPVAFAFRFGGCRSKLDDVHRSNQLSARVPGAPHEGCSHPSRLCYSCCALRSILCPCPCRCPWL